jgi:biopolymer transport protein TolR
MRRRRILRKLSMPEVVLTPLIDTALCLLVIFMVTVPMIQHNIKVELPQGSSKEVGAQQDFVVTVNKENGIFFNSYPVEKSRLAEEVMKGIDGKTDVPIYVRADTALAYGMVIEIVDVLKQAGVQYVAMSTKPVELSRSSTASPAS